MPNLALGIINILLISGLIVNMGKSSLPFSTQENTNDKGGQFIKGMMMMITLGSISFLHYTIFHMPAIVITMIVLSAIATWLLMDNLKRTTWMKIQYMD